MWLLAICIHSAIEIYVSGYYINISVYSFACSYITHTHTHMDNQIQSIHTPVPSSDYYHLFYFALATCIAFSRKSVYVISHHKMFFLVPSSSPGWEPTKQCEHLQHQWVTFYTGLVNVTTTLVPLEPAETRLMLWCIKLWAIPSFQQNENLKGIPFLFRWLRFCSQDLSFHLG